MIVNKNKKKAVRNATRKTKNTAREKQSPPPKLLNQAEFNKKYGLNFSELDVELLKSTNALGYIDPQTPFDPKSMSFHNGGAMPDYLYATGDIYEKLKQLESDREEIIEKGGLQLYQKQRQMLEEATQVIPGDPRKSLLETQEILGNLINLKKTWKP